MADIASGEWWRIDEYGTLYVYCVGDMPDYKYPSNPPWGNEKTSIQSVMISDGVTIIGDSAFYGCNALTSVTIPDSVTIIGDSAFKHCTSLTSVTIPDSVTSIGDSAFHHCTSLTSVTIPDGVTSIGTAVFSRCAALTSVTIPDSVTIIGGGAFSICTSLKSVTIPNSVTIIGDSAFSSCDSLTSVTIPNSVTIIGYFTFSSCYSLTSVTIPDSVTIIGGGAFWYCTSLTSVTIPDGVTSIGENAFDGCAALTSVTIPDSVTSIGEDAFRNCTSLKSVTIPDSVTSIGENAFDGCAALTSVTIPDSVTSIGDFTFYGCAALTSVTIPDSVTSIGTAVFSRCAALKSVTIPDSVTSIGGSAFRYCTSLTDVYYGGTEAQWEAIEIGEDNDPLLNATIHYNHKEEPMPTEETRNPQRVVYGIVPPDTFQQLILEAGILVTDFDPETGTYSGFIGATSGGVSFNANPNDVDFGEDVDGAPANTMQLRRRTHYDPVLSGTLVSMDDDTLTKLNGAADSEDITAATNTANASKTGLTPSPSTATITSLKHVTPSEDILSGDFIPHLWLIADYTNNHNASVNAGCVAIHLMNAFNTTGLQIQTQKNQKGTLPFEFHAHYDITNVTAVPFELYIRNGPIYNATTP